MLPIRNTSYLLPMCCSFWEKCINSQKNDQGCSTPLKAKRNENKIFYKRNHSLDNINHLKQKFSNVNWHEELIDNNANDSYTKFINIFVKIYDECIPLKRYKCQNKTEPRFPWISKGLLKSVNTRNKLHKRYVQKPSEERLNKFKTYTNKLYYLIQKSKKEYYNKKLLTLKWSRGVPMDPKISFRALARKGKVIDRSWVSKK